MIYFLAIACAALYIIAAALLLKIHGLHKAAEDIRIQFRERIQADTNVGLDISTSDRYMQRLAADLEQELKNLRGAYIRYHQGNQELMDGITNISHDLRTPLTAICGYLNLLEREQMPETVREYLNIIENRTAALTQLTEELFRYSLVISARQYHSQEALTLNEVLEECLAGYYGVLKEAGIEPEISMPQKKICRLLNREAVTRILGNIISNAVKYSDGDLNITLTEEGVITVRNQAADLDEVTVGRLFERFYTIESGKSGTGLGLSIARTLTEQTGGRITARKEGVFFTVELDFSAQQAVR